LYSVNRTQIATFFREHYRQIFVIDVNSPAIPQHNHCIGIAGWQLFIDSNLQKQCQIW